MTDLQQIALHLDRIATCMEATNEIAQKIATVDPQQQMQDVLDGLQKSPALGPIFSQVEKLMTGQLSPKKQGEIDASGSD